MSELKKPVARSLRFPQDLDDELKVITRMSEVTINAFVIDAVRFATRKARAKLTRDLQSDLDALQNFAADNELYEAHMSKFVSDFVDGESTGSADSIEGVIVEKPANKE